MNATETVDRLNAFLRGELSAVETYQEALRGRPSLSGKPELGKCMASHLQRVQLLKEKIESMGGQPAPSSGVWGAFARLVEKSAVSVSDSATIKALGEGEDIGLRDYRVHVSELDPETRGFVQSCLAEQEKTRDTLERLTAKIA